MHDGKLYQFSRSIPEVHWQLMAESGSSTSRFIGSQVLTVCFRVSWGLSAKQRAILQLVSNGYRLIVIRSSLTSQIVRIALVEPQHGRTEYQIPLWRAQKLLEKGVVSRDTGSLDSASELQLSVS